MYNLQLETFIVVADMGSFNKAAEALDITPPAADKADESAGKGSGAEAVYTDLFHRGLILTEAGEIII